MEIRPPAKMLLIYIDEHDKWGEARVPLAEAIVEILFEHGIAGATVQTAVMGFGANRRLHKKRLFGVTDEKPLTISVIDNEDKLRNILPKIIEMVHEGLVAMVDAEILHHGLGDAKA